MSQAEVIKHLKIKTNSVKRVHKEFLSYEKEKDKETARVEKMKAENADPHDLKQAEAVLQESALMIPETRQRLEAVFSDLQAYLSENAEDIKDTEELKTAEEIIATVEALFANS